MLLLESCTFESVLIKIISINESYRSYFNSAPPQKVFKQSCYLSSAILCTLELNFCFIIMTCDRVPTASYKSYNLAHCPIFILYLGEEGIFPILFLKMSYKSYILGLLSYNYFQIHVQPAYRQV